MKTLILFLIVAISTSCSSSYENQDDYDTNSYDNYEYESQTNTQEEDKQKLIEVCQSLDGVVDADILDDILTIRANISEIEGQKLSVQMLDEINKYDLGIKSVIVLNLNYELVGHSGAKIK